MRSRLVLPDRGRERGQHHKHAKAVDVSQLRVALVAEKLLSAGRVRSHAAHCMLTYMTQCGTAFPSMSLHAAYKPPFNCACLHNIDTTQIL
jgi:hypothetical protein